MLADEGGHPVELRTPEAAALVEADGVEPELGQVLVALHVDVRRLGPVAGVEEEPVRASPEHSRHAERCHGERPAAMALSRDVDGRPRNSSTSAGMSPPNARS